MTTPNSLSPLQPQGLRSLRAYQLARQLAHLIYDLTERFPKREFRLIGQMKEASVSTYANIAEGYGRSTASDYARFCEVARGSLAELGSYLEFCRERNLLAVSDAQPAYELYNYTWNTLGALIRSLSQKNAEGTWERALREETVPYIPDFGSTRFDSASFPPSQLTNPPQADLS